MPRKVKNPKLKQKQKQTQHVTVKVVNNIGTKRGGKGGGKRKRINSAPRGGVSTGERAPVQFYQPLSVMPQLPHAPFEQPAQPPAFAAQDFTQQITNGIRDGLVNFAREAEQIRPTNDYYVNQYTEQPSAAASAVPASAPTPTPTPTPKPKRTSTPKPTTTTTPKRTEPHEGFTYADLFPDTKDAPLREQRPPEFIRPEFTPDNIPPPIPHKAELPPTEEPAAAAASAAEEEKDIVEYAADALKQSADPEKDEYAGFTSAKAVQRAKDYMALGGDRSLKDLAIDGTFLGKRSKAYRSGTGGAAATQKAPQKKTDKPKSTFGSGLEYLN